MTSLVRGAQFVEACVGDSEMVIQLLKSAYGQLKESIARNDPDDKKKISMDDLIDAVKQYDTKMKVIRKAMPAPSTDGQGDSSKPKAKAKGKSKK